MSKILAIANQKGGVGKTTTTINLAAWCAKYGKSVLVVDIDPQGNATSGLGVEKHKVKSSVYSMLIGDSTAKDTVMHTAVDNLDIIPANIDLAGAEIELVSIDNRERLLKQALAAVRDRYDYIFIDCPPFIGLLTLNALTAADSILIPMQGEYFALEGLSQLMNTIRLAKQHLNPKLEIEGVVITMYNPRTKLVINVAEDISRFFGKKMYNTKIPRSVRLAEAPSYGLSIAQFDPGSAGGVAYRQLAEEFLGRNKDVFEPIIKVTKTKI